MRRKQNYLRTRFTPPRPAHSSGSPTYEFNEFPASTLKPEKTSPPIFADHPSTQNSGTDRLWASSVCGWCCPQKNRECKMGKENLPPGRVFCFLSSKEKGSARKVNRVRTPPSLASGAEGTSALDHSGPGPKNTCCSMGLELGPAPCIAP